jgi:hypothetical protein
MTPLAFVKTWAAQNPAYTGLVIVEREEPRGKGGWKRKTVTRTFLAQSGKAFAHKCDYKTDEPLPGWNNRKVVACGFRSNGECACCHRFYLELDLMSVRVALAEPRCFIHYASVCSDCRCRFQFPVVTPITKVRLTMEPLR